MGNHFLILKALIIVAACVAGVSAESFSTDVDASGNANVQENGRQLQLILEPAGGASVQTKQQYLYGRFDMRIKAVPGYSAGTVTSFFLYSPRPSNDEMDFELLGNITGEPYLLHTNVWTNGVGNREEQMNLWFDPCADFHTYTFIWNPHNIIWLVDNTPVRVYRNTQGIPYLSGQSLRTIAALWNGDEWATRKGQVKIDWSKGPFTAYFRDYRSDACVTSGGGSHCSRTRSQWWDWTFDNAQAAKLKALRAKYLVYDYCTDTAKYPQGFPPECALSK